MVVHAETVTVAVSTSLQLQELPRKKKESSFDPIDRADRVRAASRWTLEHPTKIMWRELIN